VTLNYQLLQGTLGYFIPKKMKIEIPPPSKKFRYFSTTFRSRIPSAPSRKIPLLWSKVAEKSATWQQCSATLLSSVLQPADIPTHAAVFIKRTCFHPPEMYQAPQLLTDGQHG